ncbi:MAG: FtsQ-type POTRA domain-containing protein [Eubacteriales bacterium]|nr:FtsQ-type POTRA domain-containing protein [Eubacteriales bacterium]
MAVRAGARASAVFPSNEIVKGRRIRIDADERTPLQSLRELLGGITLRTVLLVLAALTVISASVVLMTFNLKKAVIYGNTMYSEEQIESFLTKGRLGSNTFVMALKYHQRKVTDIPFVDRIDVDLVSPSTVRVNIREKPADGCVFYNGKNVYFSKEGIIQTVSGRSVEDAVKVNGVVLTHSNTESRILAKNQLGMDLSLELIRIMDKYGILKEADSIDVDEKSNLTVTFDKVRVRIGRNGYDEKMFKMHQILPYLEGRSGIIQMTGTEFTGENIVLSPDTPEAGKADSSPADGDA